MKSKHEATTKLSAVDGVTFLVRKGRDEVSLCEVCAYGDVQRERCGMMCCEFGDATNFVKSMDTRLLHDDIKFSCLLWPLTHRNKQFGNYYSIITSNHMTLQRNSGVLGNPEPSETLLKPIMNRILSLERW